MTKTELKSIPVNQILANFSQPREMFDRSKIKELSESILGNSLINPITVRKYKNGKYMIVSGERRWQAHKLAGLKNIQAFVKEYKSEGQMMVESLIENVHRIDLNVKEKAKYLKKIKDIEKIKTNRELAKRIGMSEQFVGHTLSYFEIEKDVAGPITFSHIGETMGLEKKERIAVIKKAQREGIGGRTLRNLAQTIRKAPEEVKKSLLSDEITTKQAEDISRIHSPKAREQALKQVKQHRHIANITPKLMERAKPEITEAVKRQFDTAQRRIFMHLNDAKLSLSKVNNNLKQANTMLNQLISKSFEYGLDRRTLITTMQQMKGISDRLKEFEIENDRFNELKDIFLERVEDRLKELK